MSHQPHKKRDAKIGADGSRSVAIKMVDTNSIWTIIADVIRLVFSIGLLLFSTVSVFYAIYTSTTTMPSSFPPWSQYLCLVISLIILGILEGLQIAVVELAHKDPNQYKQHHPRGSKLLTFENKGRNVERFLMGRQVLVVFTVFIASRITTFDHFWTDVPEAMIHSLMFSGFLGVILVVVVAQLTPQVLAAAYPVEFLNLFGMKIAFWACLIVEATGLVHTVWFLCVSIRKLAYKCVCSNTHENDYFEKISSDSALSPNVSREMLKTAQQAEVNIDDRELNKKKNKDIYHSEFVASDKVIHNQMKALLKNVQQNHDLFYIYGDQIYNSPYQCYEKFTNKGFNPPRFLLPPTHANHIPPHIVAMTLLRMYTEKSKDS